MKALLLRERALAARRQDLLLHSQQLREELDQSLTTFSPGFYAADRLISIAGWARRHGLIVVGVATAIVAWRRPRNLLTLATRSWTLWRSLRVLSEQVGQAPRPDR